ncbi:PREDICTED: defensin-like protein 24 [Camelina sativa]|uniref:Defensin-like protein 24 n=1 Tax=Camelina sativa TaxID=90675 RepID=A0ABM0XXT4_CAMSA|nr:PREDICTED: defensin-like protein 24 [Camelina sativa]
MAYSKIVIFAILALSLLLLSGAETINAVMRRSKFRCCKNQADFGTCDTKEDDRRCEKMCLHGCSANKGGGCQPIDAAPGSVCSCYC